MQPNDEIHSKNTIGNAKKRLGKPVALQIRIQGILRRELKSNYIKSRS